MYEECDSTVYINIYYTVTDILDSNYDINDLTTLNEAMLNETMESIVNNYDTDGIKVVVTFFGMRTNDIMIEQVMNNITYKRAIEKGIDAKEKINTISKYSEDKFELFY